MLSVRGWLVGLIMLATIGFVVGTSIERHDRSHESAAHVKAELAAPAAGAEGGESPARHAAEGTASEGAPSGERAAGSTEAHPEPRLLGVDLEAVPFVVLAALGSLGLAALGWARPAWRPGLSAIALAMLLFAALDVREAFHQSDEQRTGLVVLAAAIAALHLGAAGAAGLLFSRAGSAQTPLAPDTIPA